MNKILNYILIFFLFTLSSCDYKPILSYKNYKFSINVDKITGDEKVNSIITNSLNNLKGNEKEFYVTLSSKKEKNIISKDSKGDPSIFELIINVNYKVKLNGEIKNKLVGDKNRELISLLKDIKLAARQVSKELNSAGLNKILGDESGTENIHGEKVKKLDVIANDLFINSFVTPLIADVTTSTLFFFFL